MSAKKNKRWDLFTEDGCETTNLDEAVFPNKSLN
jgi:hypothetical protein